MKGKCSFIINPNKNLFSLLFPQFSCESPLRKIFTMSELARKKRGRDSDSLQIQTGSPLEKKAQPDSEEEEGERRDRQVEDCQGFALIGWIMMLVAPAQGTFGCLFIA